MVVIAQSRICCCGVEILDCPRLSLRMMAKRGKKVGAKKFEFSLAVFGTPPRLTLIHDAQGHETQEPG